MKDKHGQSLKLAAAGQIYIKKKEKILTNMKITINQQKKCNKIHSKENKFHKRKAFFETKQK